MIKSVNLNPENGSRNGWIKARRIYGLWDLTAKILSEASNNTELEPKLVPLSGEDLSNWTANRSNEARLDVQAHGFWERGKQTFFSFKVLQSQRLLISQQITSTMWRYERKW